MNQTIGLAITLTSLTLHHKWASRAGEPIVILWANEWPQQHDCHHHRHHHRHHHQVIGRYVPLCPLFSVPVPPIVTI